MPDALTVMARGPNRVPALAVHFNALAPSFGQKVALGTVDIVSLDPTSAGKLHIRPDGICVNTPGSEEVLRQDSIPGGDQDSIFVSFLLDRGTEPAEVLLFGSGEFCAMLTPEVAARPEESRVGALTCTSKGWGVEELDGGGVDVGVELAALRALVGPPSEDGVMPGGAVKIVVARNPPSPAKLRALLERVAIEGCAPVCGDLVAAGGLACAGKAYTFMASGFYKTDPIPCHINVIPTFTYNDYGLQCDNPKVSGLVACGHTPGQLKFWTDSCGGVLVPFDWSSIRRNDQGADILREVAGRSATGRAEKGGDRRLWIPGREFVGSTPPHDPNAVLGTTDWRLPEVEVWYPAGSPQSLGLIGTVDEDKSILRVFPRVPVGVLCDTPSPVLEACMAVGGGQHGSGIDCACRDAYAATCSCKTDTALRLFACSDSSMTPTVAGQPCTRHAHCNPTGKCDVQPFCVKEDAVWHPGAAWPSNPQACWDDDGCIGQPGKRTQCGFKLFDLSGRPASNVGELDAVLDFTSGARVRRGICKGQRSDACKNHPSSSPRRKECLAGVGPCRGYTLSAGQER